jgi:hypothetical protein
MERPLGESNQQAGFSARFLECSRLDCFLGYCVEYHFVCHFPQCRTAASLTRRMTASGRLLPFGYDRFRPIAVIRERINRRQSQDSYPLEKTK